MLTSVSIKAGFCTARRGLKTSRKQVACVATATGMKPAQAPIIAPATRAHTASVFWLHGLGDTGDGWADVASQLQQQLPHVKFVFPTASLRPISLNGGMRMTGWFDIRSLDNINSTEDKAGIDESVAYLNSLIDEELQSNPSLTPSRIVVAGFSQGGAVALRCGAQRQPALGGVVALSTWLPLAAEYSPRADGPPVLCCHGTADNVVRTAFGQASHARLQELGFQAEWKTYAMAHSAVPQELQDVTQWLQARLP